MKRYVSQEGGGHNVTGSPNPPPTENPDYIGEENDITVESELNAQFQDNEILAGQTLVNYSEEPDKEIILKFTDEIQFPEINPDEYLNDETPVKFDLLDELNRQTSDTPDNSVPSENNNTTSDASISNNDEPLNLKHKTDYLPIVIVGVFALLILKG